VTDSYSYWLRNGTFALFLVDSTGQRRIALSFCKDEDEDVNEEG